MIDDKRVLAIIPARGGSKGLPRKNLRSLAGKPLIAWTIECALRSAYVDRVILSSDDLDIMRIASSFGCEVPFRRPAELATDDAPGMAAVTHALREVSDGEVIVLLQPTSPLRNVGDIDACVAAVGLGGAPACVSVVPVKHPPEYMYTLRPDSTMIPALSCGDTPARRQDLHSYMALNGAVYAAHRETLATRETFLVPGCEGHVMPPERSVDIDLESDLRYAEWLLRARDEEGSAL